MIKKRLIALSLISSIFLLTGCSLKQNENIITNTIEKENIKEYVNIKLNENTNIDFSIVDNSSYFEYNNEREETFKYNYLDKITEDEKTPLSKEFIESDYYKNFTHILTKKVGQDISIEYSKHEHPYDKNEKILIVSLFVKDTNFDKETKTKTTKEYPITFILEKNKKENKNNKNVEAIWNYKE